MHAFDVYMKQPTLGGVFEGQIVVANIYISPINDKLGTVLTVIFVGKAYNE